MKLYLNIFKQVIGGGGGPYEGYTAPVVYLSTHYYKYFYLKYHVILKESFIDSYVEDFFESEKITFIHQKITHNLGMK